MNDGRYLTNLRCNQRQPLFRQSKDVDLDVKGAVCAEFADHAARQDVDILEALENASEGAGISVSRDPKPK